MIDDPRDDLQPAEFDFYDVGRLADSPAAWQPPPALRLAALGYLVLGLLAFEEVLVGWFLVPRRSLNVGWLLVGWWLLRLSRNLVRWRSGAGIWTSWLGSVFFIACIIVAISSISRMVRAGPVEPPSNFVFWPIGSWQTTVFSLAGCAYFVWLLNAMCQPDVGQRFSIPNAIKEQLPGWQEYLAERQRWRFGLRTLFVVSIIAAILSMRLASRDVMYESRNEHASVGAGTLKCEVYYGTKANRYKGFHRELEYVVIVQSGLQKQGVDINRAMRSVAFANVNGETVTVPGWYQLHQIVDGKIQSRRERVSLANLEDFIESQPTEVSLEALIKHAEIKRNEAATEE